MVTGDVMLWEIKRMFSGDKRHHVVEIEGKHSVVYIGQATVHIVRRWWETFNSTHHWILETSDSERNVCFTWTVYVNGGYPKAKF
jgi:hypothetical protein